MKNLVRGLIFVTALMLIFNVFGPVKAEETVQTPSTQVTVEKVLLPDSGLYVWVKTKEFVRLNILTYQDGSKAKVLESFTETRVKEMNYADYIKNDNALDKSLNRYQSQKEKALNYAEKSDKDEIINEIKDQTVEQQKQMTKIQIDTDNANLQNNIVVVQKNIANKVINTVEITQGKDKATEIENQINYVWVDPNADENGNLLKLPDKWEYAPGTQGRDSAGKLIKVQTDQGEVEIYQGSNASGQIKVNEDKTDNSSSSNNKVEVNINNADSSVSTEVNSGNSSVKVDTSNGNVEVKTEE
ncbi:MAG: hypothetical protein ACD_58C00021G0005 [uncultured bacterium]|nr:MAG: hypothetical protein ACD_58C00021G0005 [uncultured bacterium]